MVVSQSDRRHCRCEAWGAALVAGLMFVALVDLPPGNFKVVAGNENRNYSISDLYELIVTLEKRVKVQEEFLGHIAAAALRITTPMAPMPDLQLPASAPVSASTSALGSSSISQTELTPNKHININAKPELRVIYKDPDCFNGQTFGNPLFIISPLFPDAYPANRLCRWVIEAPPEHSSIQFRFTNFAVKPCSGCSCDYVEVLDLRPDNSTIDFRLCFAQTLHQDHLKGSKSNCLFEPN